MIGSTKTQSQVAERIYELIPDPILWMIAHTPHSVGSGIRNDKQPNIRHAFGGPLYRWSFSSAAGFPDQEARWLYEEATSRKRQATSRKRQATSCLTLDLG